MASITNVINSKFASSGAPAVAKDAETVSRAQTRLGQSSASASRQFAAQSQGLGGLVGAYAGAAATSFALQAAFDALANSARSLQTIEGLGALANASGESASALLSSVREITKGQLTLTEAAQQINISLSAGFDTEQIEGLAGVAIKASRALGRDLTDAFTRVVRGSAKLETELLDELGIFTKIEPATAAYAAVLGKTRLELTEYERLQGFVNAVIEEGNRKFSAINTTIPTTSEQIEAFGVKIVDLATQLGGFIAQTLAPLASFLTNNLAGAFAAVGTITGLVASKGVDVLKGKLEDFADSANRRGASVEQFFLKYSAAARQAREEAQKTVASINLQKGIGGESQVALKALKTAADTRILTGGELKQGIALLAERESKLLSIKATEEARIRALEDEKSKLKQVTAATKASSAEYKAATENIIKTTEAITKQTRALETTDLRIQQTAASLKVLEASAKGATSGLARVASAGVTGFISLGASIGRTGANIVGFAGNALSIVSILSLVGSAIASAIGKQDEYNATLEKFGSLVSAFFSPKTSQSIQKGLLSVTGKALSDLESVDSNLKNIDDFRFSTKFLGVAIDVVKTKEDLIKEVSSALKEAATEGNKSFGEKLSDNAIGVGAGALIGKSLGAAAGTVAAAKLGATLGVAAGPIGVAVGTLAGAAIGFAISSALKDTGPLPDDIKNNLKDAFGQDLFSGDQGQQLETALVKIEQQAGAAKNLSFEGRKYYETQQQLAISLVKNLKNIQQTQQVAERLGIELAQLENVFSIEVTDSNIKLSPTLSLDIPITLSVIDQAKAIATISDIADLAAGQTKLSDTDLSFFYKTKEIDVAPINNLKNAYEDAASNLYEAQISALQFESALSTLSSGIDNNSLSLETLAQAEGAVAASFKRSIREASESQVAIESLIAARQALESKPLRTRSDNARLAEIVSTIQLLETENSTLQANVLLQQDRLASIRAIVDPYEAQLKVLEQIKETFGDLANARLPKLGDIDASGSFIPGEENRQITQYAELNRLISESAEAAGKQKTQEQAVADIAKGRVDEQAIILQYSNMTREQLFAQRSALGDIENSLLAAVTLNSEDLGLAQQYNAAIQTRQNLLRDVADAVLATAEATAKSLDNIAADLRSKISSIEIANIQAGIQFNLDMIDIESQAAQAAFAFEQAFKQNEIKLLQLQIDNKAVTPETGTQQINALEQEIINSRERAIASERMLLAERKIADDARLQAEKLAAIETIEAESKANKAKIESEYSLLVAIANTYSSIADVMKTSISEAGNNAGRAIVTAAGQAATAMAIALGTDVAIVMPTFKDIPIEIDNSRIDVAIEQANTSLANALETETTLKTTALAQAEDIYTKQRALSDATYQSALIDLDNKAKLLAQEKQISVEEAKKRLTDAAGSSASKDAELTNIDKKLQQLFDSIKGNIETAIMSLNNLIFYGEGNFGDIMSNLFKSIQQDFFKQTIADPLSSALTDSLFGLFGIKNMKRGIENAKVENGALLVKVIEGPEQLISGLFSGGSSVTNPNPSGNFLGNILGSLFGGLFMSQGGLVHLAQGGAASSATMRRDRVPAMLEPGEFVLRKQSARKIGLPALQSMNATGNAGGAGNVYVNVTNEGSPKQAEASQPRFDGEKYIVDVVMRDLSNNGPIRRSLRGGI